MAVFADIMGRLHGADIWAGVAPAADAAAVQGWNGDHPALLRLAAAPGTRVIIDVGVWKGQSTIAMAGRLRDGGIDGCVIAVDTFLGSPEHWGGEGLFATRHGMPDLYATFLGNVAAAGLQGFVVPMPQTASGAAAILRRLGVTASLVHIDGDHAHASVLQDARDYWPILEAGGHLVGDDYHPSWPGVMQAAREFAGFVERPLRIEAPKWIIQKAGSLGAA
ncbi:class I SAM-dependent methyltransferase [Plastoroseomonas arctica]|uniref:Class I SAM-dependent methyltransferase n=1 Tax=Plastoroseomonas arctica TaxID=1509237 RepID=A0AAF1K743_9PROT|nr:class I SAM-dependent methyltransferase [Plastoroseomonas arctica]MBR0657588.1 class I SAM-dependent methyltransferase [Plastoroseomonas arctica]